MAGVGVGMEEDDGEGGDALGGKSCRCLEHGGLVEGHAHVAVHAHALRHLQPQVARYQRKGLYDLDVVELVFALAADLERVAEALGGDEPGRRTLALDHGIVKSVVACTTRAMSAAAMALDDNSRSIPNHHAFRGIGVGGELLVAHLAARARLIDDDVGERPADVDPQPQALHGCLLLALSRWHCRYHRGKLPYRLD